MLGFAAGSQARVMTTGKIPPRSRDAQYDASLDTLLALAATHGDTLDQLAWITQTPSERLAFTDEIVDAAIAVLTSRMDEGEKQVWRVFMDCNAEPEFMDVVEARHARQHWQEA